MKFRYIGPKRYDEQLSEIASNSYGGKQVKHGDVIEMNDYYSSKALLNPNYEEVKTRKRSAPTAPASNEGLIVND